MKFTHKSEQNFFDNHINVLKHDLLVTSQFSLDLLLTYNGTAGLNCTKFLSGVLKAIMDLLTV